MTVEATLGTGAEHSPTAPQAPVAALSLDEIVRRCAIPAEAGIVPALSSFPSLIPPMPGSQGSAPPCSTPRQNARAATDWSGVSKSSNVTSRRIRRKVIPTPGCHYGSGSNWPSCMTTWFTLMALHPVRGLRSIAPGRGETRGTPHLIDEPWHSEVTHTQKSVTLYKGTD
jgi:hypothetical protein